MKSNLVVGVRRQGTTRDAAHFFGRRGGGGVCRCECQCCPQTHGTQTREPMHGAASVRRVGEYPAFSLETLLGSRYYRYIQ